METALTEEANVETVPAGECDRPVNLEVGKFAALRLHMTTRFHSWPRFSPLVIWK